jgi:hypothetical protein
VIKQLKNTWVFMFLFWSTTIVDAQVFDPTTPISRGDSSALKSDTTATSHGFQMMSILKPKILRIH